jgi:hypothetical protein
MNREPAAAVKRDCDQVKIQVEQAFVEAHFVLGVPLMVGHVVQDGADWRWYIATVITYHTVLQCRCLTQTKQYRRGASLRERPAECT